MGRSTASTEVVVVVADVDVVESTAAVLVGAEVVSGWLPPPGELVGWDEPLQATTSTIRATTAILRNGLLVSFRSPKSTPPV